MVLQDGLELQYKWLVQYLRLEWHQETLSIAVHGLGDFERLMDAVFHDRLCRETLQILKPH